LVEGRVQFITIQSPGNGSLTIINIYAPRSSNDKAQLRQKINQADFSSDHIILGGDFNHLEVTDCRGTTGERQMHKREASSWHHMTLRYGLIDAWHQDSFRKLSKKEFTFGNGRVGASSAVSRIDKFMISQTVEERGGRIEATTSVRKFTDHSPLVIMVWGKHDVTINPLRFFDTSLLNDERGRQEMWDAWVGNHHSPPPPPTIWIGRPSLRPPLAG
jgi:exonuclease III